MPGCRTHDFITAVTAAGAVGAYFYVAPSPSWENALYFTGSYLFAGYACAGDLDLNSREYHRWGPLKCIWWPYRVCVPHRSWVSHGLIMGGVLRIVYLLAVFTLIAACGFWTYGRFHGIEKARVVAIQQWASLDGFVLAHPVPIALSLSGFILAGTVHSLSDLISTWFKRRF